jgi:hypothetical protein
LDQSGNKSLQQKQGKEIMDSNEKRSRFDQHEDEDDGGLQTKRDRKW